MKDARKDVVTREEARALIDAVINAIRSQDIKPLEALKRMFSGANDGGDGAAS